MNIESTTAVFLDETGAVSITQLVEQSGLTEAELSALVDCGALEPSDAAAGALRFSQRCVVTARTARRLRDDFALDDAHAVALLLRFVQRIEALERQLRELQARR
ncbi:MAG: chaperone modulator CbpM [Rudaea sp.]